MQASFDFAHRFGIDNSLTFYPAENHAFLLPSGKLLEFHSGVRYAVVRTERIAFFARVRPGLLRLSDLRAEFAEVLPPKPGLPVIPAHVTRFGAQTNFALDFGGTVEFYPTRRTFIRADFGDEYVRYGAFQKVEQIPGDPPIVYDVDWPATAQHQYKVTFGAGWRFGTSARDGAGNVPVNQERRWTVGAHYSAFYIDGWRSGAGVQVSRRLVKFVDWSAVANIFPGYPNSTSVLWFGQKITQFQTGPSVQLLGGKTVSIKAHVRPGFLHFSDYLLFAPVGYEHTGAQNEFDLAYGLGTEFSFWKRVPLRIEVSDNLIKHADIRGTYMNIRPFWDHAPQISGGIALRF